MQKQILITGATSGIGYETAKTLARQGHSVIFTARDEHKAEKLRQELIALGSKKADFVLCNFASLYSVSEAAKTVLANYPAIDVLINNAGTWEMEFKESEDGIELNFAVNHLAPFLFTNLLLPALKNAPAARIVNTSSMAHRRDILQLNDIEFRKQPYNGIATYSQSKLCNLLFSLQLIKELKVCNMTVNTVHPGYVQTNLFNNMGTRDWGNVPNAADGARSAIFAALSEKLEGLSGRYIYHEQEEEPTAMAKDEALAKKVWDLSLGYVKGFL